MRIPTARRSGSTVWAGAILAVGALLGTPVAAQYAPQISSFEVSPTRGQTGLGPLMQTEFEFVAVYQDIDGDQPTEMFVQINGPMAQRVDYDTSALAGADARNGLRVRIPGRSFGSAGAYRATMSVTDKDGTTQSTPVNFTVESTLQKLGLYIGFLVGLYLAMVFGLYHIIVWLGAECPSSAEVALGMFVLLGWLWTVWWWHLYENQTTLIVGSVVAVLICGSVVLIGQLTRVRE